MDIEPCLGFLTPCNAVPCELRFCLLGMHAHLPGPQRSFPFVLQTASWRTGSSLLGSTLHQRAGTCAAL